MPDHESIVHASTTTAHYILCERDVSPPKAQTTKDTQDAVEEFFAKLSRITSCNILHITRASGNFCLRRQKGIKHEYSNGMLRGLFAACGNCDAFKREPSNDFQSNRFTMLTEEGYLQARARFEELRILKEKRTGIKSTPVCISHKKKKNTRADYELEESMRRKLTQLETAKGDDYLAGLDDATKYSRQAIRAFHMRRYKWRGINMALALRAYFDKAGA